MADPTPARARLARVRGAGCPSAAGWAWLVASSLAGCGDRSPPARWPEPPPPSLATPIDAEPHASSSEGGLDAPPAGPVEEAGSGTGSDGAAGEGASSTSTVADPAPAP